MGTIDASITGLENISAATAAAGVTITLSGQTEGFTVTGSNNGDTLTGGSGADTIIAGTGSDVITGGAGDDTIDGGADDDTINGESGMDTATYANASAGVTVNLSNTGVQNTVGAGNDTIINIENLIGSDFNDTLTGDDKANIISGGTGNDTLYGGDGNDTINSGSIDTLAATITNILTNNAGVVYSADTNSFYQYVATGTSWTASDTAASAATLTGLTGVNGHLVTITSQTENDFITTLVGANRVWTAGSDATTEGEWFWIRGPESGQQFWTGGASGSAFNSMYSNWTAGDPSNGNFAWDYAEHIASAQWWSNASIATTPGYVIEWEADSLISTINNTTIYGGAGDDDLYGSAGIDIFMYDTLSSDVDTIFNFSTTGRDQLNFADIVNYDPLTHDITDFIQFTESGGNTTIAIDGNGTSGGSSYADAVILDSVTDLDISLMIAGDNLIVS